MCAAALTYTTAQHHRNRWYTHTKQKYILIEMSLWAIRCKFIKESIMQWFDLRTSLFLQSIYLLTYKHNILFLRMNYLFIQGSHNGNRLLYIKSEKRLYVEKCQRNDRRIFICYQTVLLKRKKVKFIC